jgi:hypothetical protein
MQEEARYYRAQAQICMTLASHLTDAWVVVALHEMAAKYISHAAKLEGGPAETPNRKPQLDSGAT